MCSKIWTGLHVDHALFFADLKELEFYRQIFSEKKKEANFMKIRPVRIDGRTHTRQRY
jgi:hypothetical protein